MSFKKIDVYCKEAENEFDLISPERAIQLKKLSKYFADKFKQGLVPKVIVICTHNSRRSHFGQVWLAVAADYYGLAPVHTFSGGTEATAFNPRAVRTLKNIGFYAETEEPELANPLYHLKWSEEMQPYAAFSKKYIAQANPQNDFAAVMVCTSADEACPLVEGCDFRLALPYQDPKAFDDSPQEVEQYAERCRQICREMLFVMKNVQWV